MDNKSKRSNFLRFMYSKIVPSDEIPPMSKYMIDHKIARNEFQALFGLFLIIAVSILLTVNFLTITIRKPTSPYITAVGANKFSSSGSPSNALK